MRQIVRRIARHQRVEIIAADPALYLRESFGDFFGLARAEVEHVAKQCKSAIIRARWRQIPRDLAEMQKRAVGKGCVHRTGIVAHGAVAQRTSAAGIVAGHAADGGPRRRGHVDRKPQAVLLELAVEVVEHDPRLDHTRAVLEVERDDAVQVFGEIDHNAVIDGLATLRGAAAARRHDPSLVAGNRQRPQRLVHGFRHHHARGHDLVERGVGRIAAAVEGIEEHVAGDFAREPVFECRCALGHSIPVAAAAGLCVPGSGAGKKCSSPAQFWILNAKYRLTLADQAGSDAAGASSFRCSTAAVRLLRRCLNRMSLSSLPARRRSASRMVSCSRIASPQRSRCRAKLAV